MLRRNYLRMDKKRKIFILKAVMFYGMICICYSIGLTLARYYSTGSFAPSLGVAKWDVAVDNNISNHSLNLVCGGNPQSYSFTVESQSEVTTKYSILLSDLPDDIEVSLDGGTFQTPVNHSITYTDVATFGVQDTQRIHTHTLSFKAPLDATMLSVNDIGMKVKFSQVI